MKKKLLLQDFADHIALREGISKKDADTFARAFFDTIEQGLHEDKFVKIKGFGTFKLVAVSDRESINVNTGERIQISGHTKVSFTPDNSMKELVNRPFAHFESVDLNDDTDTTEFEVIDREMEEEERNLLAALEALANAGEDEDEDAETPDTDEAKTEDMEDDDEASAEDETGEEEAMPETETTEMPVTMVADPDQTEATGLVVTHPESISELAHPEPEEPDDTPVRKVSIAAENEAEEPVLIPIATDSDPNVPMIEEPGDTESKDTNNPANPPQKNGTNTAAGTDEQTTKIKTGTDEEIVVTSPKTINPQPDGHTSNTLGYTYNEVPSRRKHNPWKTATLVLITLCLMGLSYFVGYFRIFCPCSFPFLQEELQQPAPTRPQMPTASEPAKPMQAKPKQADKTVNTPVETGAKAAPETTPTQPRTESQHTSQPTDKAVSTQQRPTAKPTANPTQQEKPMRPAYHTVGTGDNLYRISRKYYGDDSHVSEIMRVNNLNSEGVISKGMKLKLP